MNVLSTRKLKVYFKPGIWEFAKVFISKISIFAETKLWLEINKQGNLTKKLITLFIFTFLYGIAVSLHLYTFRYWGYSIRRCEVPALESYFGFNQILDISTYGIEPESRLPGITIYCKYADRQYTKLLEENNNNFESIMTHLQNSKEPFNEIKCTHKIKEQKPEPQLSLLSKSFLHIFDERNKTCNDFKFYGITQANQFLGVIVGAISMSLVADRYGRRPIFISCYVCQLTGLIFFFIPFVSCMILSGFLTGIGMYGFLVLYIILTEQCDRKRRLTLGTSVLFSIPLSRITGVVIEIAAKSWKYPIFFSIGILIIIAPLIYWFVDEPPKYLMYSGRVQKCIKVLEKYGYRRDSTSSIPKMPAINTRFLLGRLFHPRLRIRHAYSFFFSYLLSIVGSIHETHAVIVIGKFDMSFANILIGIFECIHLGVLCIIISRDMYGRKGLMFSFFMVLTVSHVFAFAQYDHTSTELFISILYLFVYSLGHAGLYFLVFYYMELYPTRFRVSCLSFNALGMSMGLLTSIGLSDLNWDPLPTIFFPEFVASSVCWLMSCFACETVGSDIPDNLRETP